MGGQSIQSLGGKARAQSLTEEERREIASHAAASRWNILKATHPGVLELGNSKIPCAVLEDGTRVLTQQGVLTSIGRARAAKGGEGASVDGMPAFLRANNLKPFIHKELEESTKPIIFKMVKGGKAFGYKASILPMICQVFLEARDAGVLHKSQMHIARTADLLMRSLAHVGIIALVDEATGYQEVRDRQALQKILEMFISKELLKWTKRFPDDFYHQMFRLKGWEFPKEGSSKPQVVGHYTNDIVYDRLAPEVLTELKKLNPPDEKGNRAHKHHQWLTPDVGHPKLRDHISGVIALMKSVDNWTDFMKALKRVYPKKKAGDTIEMDFNE